MGLADEVRQRLEIVEVVSRYVPLTPAGRSFKARCPFHTERTPSFSVSPERQTWHCFGACATGGDVISFVMKMEKLSFGEALRLLARQAGIALQTPQSAPGGARDPLAQANEAAARFYHQHLLSAAGAEARAYVEGRGLAPETVEAFMLGLSPPQGEVLKAHLTGLGFPEELLLRAGLLRTVAPGHAVDLFRGRLLFPIRNPQAHVVGFGGRSLDGGEPKYLNTPQTPLFDKGHLLYGLDAAADAIRLTGEGVVVEGYMDVLLAHQHGFRNVVASMGTALTRHQVDLLRGLARSFVLALDPDAAGQEATLRSLEGSWGVFQGPRPEASSLRPGLLQPRPLVTLRVALLPADQDPDELVRADPGNWARLMEQAPSLLDYLFEVLPSRYDLTTPVGRLQLAERLGNLILFQNDPGEQDRYLERLERLVQVDRRTLEEALDLRRRALLAQARQGRPSPVQSSVAPFARASGEPVEEYVLALLLRYPSLKEHLSPEAAQGSPFFRAENRELFRQWANCSTIEELRECLDPSLSSHLDTLLAHPHQALDLRQRQEALSWALRRLEERALRELKRQESTALAELKGEPEQEAALLATAVERNRRLRRLVTGEGEADQEAEPPPA